MTSVQAAVAALEHGPWLEVDLDAVRRNARRYVERVGSPILPMVKANGYGMGLVAVARELESLDPWGFGVATLEEAAALRAARVDRPVIAFLPFVARSAAAYRGLGVRPVIGTRADLTEWLRGGAHPFHLSIDTGMGRGGFAWWDEDLAAIGDQVRGAPGYEGVFTHFHSADGDEAATAEQWARFTGAVARLGATPRWVHAANSAAGRWGRRFAGTLTRPGIFLYGGRAGDWAPEPVARLEAMVHAVHPARIGDTISYGATARVTAAGQEIVTLGVGYADGVLRALSGRGEVAVGGRVVPIAGRVTMDMTMVVVPAGTVAVGDRAIIFGGPIDLDDQAARAGTISYELLTAVGPRVRRRYRGGEE